MSDVKGNCHQCGETLDNYSPPRPEFGERGIGICSEHGVAYDSRSTPSPKDEGEPTAF